MTTAGTEGFEGIVDKAIAGDKAAFSEIVRRMMKPVIALTYRMTQNRESAVDLAQDTFVTAWQKLNSFQRESKFECWLFTIATNKTLNFLKSRAEQSVPFTDDMQSRLAAKETPESEMARIELRRNVLAFMKSLPEQQRIVFNLRFYRQMSFEEIAAATGKAIGTVKTNYREAIKKLRESAVEKGWR